MLNEYRVMLELSKGAGANPLEACPGAHQTKPEKKDQTHGSLIGEMCLEMQDICKCV
jgi:hypothetical protein